MSYSEQVYYGQTINNLTAIKTLGNLTGGTFTAGTAVGWTTGAANGATVIFTSATANSNVTNLKLTSPSISTPPLIVPTDGSAPFSETASVTFHNLAAGQTLSLAGLTFTAGTAGATAAQVASAFSGISVTPVLFSNLDSAKASIVGFGETGFGSFTAGTSAGWSTGTGSSTVLFTSTTSNTNVVNLSSWPSIDPAAPTISEIDGTVSTQETATVIFHSLNAGQTLSMEGLTFTAGASGANATQLAGAFANLSSGVSAATINSGKSLGDSTGGTFTAGTSAGWSTGTNTGTGLVFSSTTLTGNVTNLTSNPTIDPAAPTISETDGSAGVTETAAVTFNSMTAGQTVSIAGLTFTAGATGATDIQVANAFASIAVGNTADTLDNSPLTMASAYVVTPGVQTTATSLSGYITSPLDGKTYTFLAAGTFTVTSGTGGSAANTTIAATKGSVTSFQLFYNGSLIDTINYGAPVDDSMFGVTDVTPVTAAVLVTQRAQAAQEFNKIKSLIDSGGTFIGSNASNGGNDQVQGGSGNDIFTGNTGNDYFDGKSGANTSVYRGLYADYTINSVTTTDRTDPAGLSQVSAISIADSVAGRDGTDTLVNTQRLKFADTTVALDIGATQNAGAAYMLYKAAFNRAPDATGLGFWIQGLDNGANLVDGVSANFITSPEFGRLYGTSPSIDTFVNLLYQNVLHRTPDANGYAFWTAGLNATDNLHMRAQILEDFASSPENIAQVGTLIAHGIQYQAYVG